MKPTSPMHTIAPARQMQPVSDAWRQKSSSAVLRWHPRRYPRPQLFLRATIILRARSIARLVYSSGSGRGGNTAVGTDAPVGKIVRVSRLIRCTVPDIMTHGRRHSINPSSAAQPKGGYGKPGTHLFETNRLVV